MSNEIKSEINDFLKEVEKTRELYRVMMDCIYFHIADGNDCSNIFPLATIIDEKFKNLQASSDKIFLNIYNK